MPAPQPVASAARFPSEYGQTPELKADIQSWDEVAERITAARNYLLASIGPTGDPYQRPIDGVFVEGALCFGGSPETRWVRNLQERPSVSISLPDDDHAVILSGRVELIDDPEAPLSIALAPANRAKYPQYYTDGILGDDFLPFWCLRPERVYAWSLTDFPARATRFDF
jgi:hypothetical protein